MWVACSPLFFPPMFSFLSHHFFWWVFSFLFVFTDVILLYNICHLNYSFPLSFWSDTYYTFGVMSSNLYVCKTTLLRVKILHYGAVVKVLNSPFSNNVTLLCPYSWKVLECPFTKSSATKSSNSSSSWHIFYNIGSDFDLSSDLLFLKVSNEMSY